MANILHSDTATTAAFAAAFLAGIDPSLQYLMTEDESCPGVKVCKIGVKTLLDKIARGGRKTTRAPGESSDARFRRHLLLRAVLGAVVAFVSCPLRPL